MTVGFRRRKNLTCPSCGHQYEVFLEDDFSQWVRQHPDLDSSKGIAFMDKDLVAHRFKTSHGRGFQCMMCVEVKIYGAILTESQRDTMFMVDQLFRTDTTTPTKRARRHVKAPTKILSSITMQEVDVKLFGYHLLRMNGSSPTNSTWITWDEKRRKDRSGYDSAKVITEDQLINLLRFDLHPDTLQPYNFRIHHAVQLHFF